jgi:hypothetical protein
MSSRKIEDLTSKMQSLYLQFKTQMDAVKIPFIVTCTSRTTKEQYALYAQGRHSLQEVNYLRNISGMSLINEEENKRKVTWTLNSKHLIDLDDNSQNNDKSRAFDIVIIKDRRAIWDIKVNVNANDIPDYKEAGMIGQSIGLKWGGTFSSPDYPHFEDPA